MGYSVNNFCTETYEQALQKTCSSFPYYQNGELAQCTASATEITIIKATASTTIAPTFQPCDFQALGFDSSQSALFFSSAFIATVSFFLLAKTIGTIIQFIDKHTK